MDKIENSRSVILDTRLNSNSRSKKDPSSTISNFTLYFTYSFFTILNLLVNMDSGNIPPVTAKISQEFSISKKEVGGLSSFVSIGTLIGGIISFSIIDILPRKFILLVFNCFIALCLFLFPLFENSFILYANRIVVGVFMVNFILIDIDSLTTKYSFQCGLISLVQKSRNQLC